MSIDHDQEVNEEGEQEIIYSSTLVKRIAADDTKAVHPTPIETQQKTKTRSRSDWNDCRIVKIAGKGLVEVAWQDGGRTICKSMEVLENAPLKVGFAHGVFRCVILD